MSAQLSIVIPVLNAAEALPATLDALLPGVAQGVIREVIVTDGGSTDGSAQLARDAGCEVVTGPPGRGGQLRRGAQAAKGQWLLFLHADTHLPPQWVGAVCTHQDPQLAGYFRLSFRSNAAMARVIAGGAGGYADMPLMEDVAIARALTGRLVMLPETVTTDATRYKRGGWARRSARNLWTLARYLGGADPTKLAQAYHKA